MIDSKGDTDKLEIIVIVNLIKNELKIEQYSDVELSNIQKKIWSLSNGEEDRK